MITLLYHPSSSVKSFQVLYLSVDGPELTGLAFGLVYLCSGCKTTFAVNIRYYPRISTTRQRPNNFCWRLFQKLCLGMSDTTDIRTVHVDVDMSHRKGWYIIGCYAG